MRDAAKASSDEIALLGKGKQTNRQGQGQGRRKHVGGAEGKAGAMRVRGVPMRWVVLQSRVVRPGPGH
jgi:hypothetical protein